MQQIMVTTPATVAPGQLLEIVRLPVERGPDLPPPWLDYRVVREGPATLGYRPPESIANLEADLGERLALLEQCTQSVNQC